MSILTKPAVISKGTPALFTLNKSELAALSAISSDSYFSDSTNWSQIYLFYKSVEGNQTETVSFDARNLSPSAFFDVSLQARNAFTLQNILIFDFDNAAHVVKREQIPAATTFDVTLT